MRETERGIFTDRLIGCRIGVISAQRWPHCVHFVDLSVLFAGFKKHSGRVNCGRGPGALWHVDHRRSIIG